MNTKFLAILFLLAGIGAAFAEEEAKVKQAEVIRSVSGTSLDEKGFSKGSVPVKKGDTFEVSAESISEVTVKTDSGLVKLPKDSVKITEVAGSEAITGSPLRIVSAKLGFPGDRDYEVKEEVKKIIKKRIAAGQPITATSPVQIPVTQDFLRAKAYQATTVTSDVGGQPTLMRRSGSLVLTITYEFDGKRDKKSAMEGGNIALP